MRSERGATVVCSVELAAMSLELVVAFMLPLELLGGLDVSFELVAARPLLFVVAVASVCVFASVVIVPVPVAVDWLGVVEVLAFVVIEPVSFGFVWAGVAELS